MRWVTRRNASVDRVACPWLIRRFVDPQAEFVFVARDTDAATITDGIPYDMTGVELGHVDGRCSFESILVKHGLTGDPALVLLGRIVHGADIPPTCPPHRPKRTGCAPLRTALRPSTAKTTRRRSGWKARCTTPSTPGAASRCGGLPGDSRSGKRNVSRRGSRGSRELPGKSPLFSASSA